MDDTLQDRKTPGWSYRRRVLPLLRWIVLVVLGGFIVRACHFAILDLKQRQIDWREVRVGWLLASSALYLLAQVPPALFWRMLIVQMGQAPGFYEAVRAYFVGHLGKYVPGKIAVVAIRAALLRTNRVDVGIASISVFVETFAAMGMGTFLASLALFALPSSQVLGQLRILAALMMVAMSLLIYPGVVRLATRMVLKRRWDQHYKAWTGALRTTTMIQGCLLSIVSWCLMTLSYCAITWSLPMEPVFPSSLHDLVLAICAITMSVVAGFISLLPGGMGVREWVMDQVLAPQLGESFAILSVILLRLIWLATEMVVSALLYSVPVRGSTSQERGNAV